MIALPQRDDKHVTESKSFQIFRNSVPAEWIVREVSERDYGIDCYLELVNKNNQVTGELISIQLKGLNSIPWTKDDYYTFSGIKISTTNYWNKFPVPVFICLTDNTTGEAFFHPVKTALKENYIEYAQQKKFSYQIHKKNKLCSSNLIDFLKSYFREKDIKKFEQEVISFISYYSHYSDFISFHSNRDRFMEIESDRVLFLYHFYNNLEYLCSYLDIDWNIKTLKEFRTDSEKDYGPSENGFHEGTTQIIVEELEKMFPELSIALNQQICKKEMQYWLSTNSVLFNTFFNIGKNGELSF